MPGKLTLPRALINGGSRSSELQPCADEHSLLRGDASKESPWI